MICRRCAGRGKRIEEEAPCYICDGKGNIHLDVALLKRYFEEMRDRYEKARVV